MAGKLTNNEQWGRSVIDRPEVKEAQERVTRFYRQSLTPRSIRARRLLVSAALDLTRNNALMRRACILVLVHGYGPTRAAAKVKATRQNVARAVRRLRPKLLEVTKYAEAI